jgi:Flp pilus assembly protein TadD
MNRTAFKIAASTTIVAMTLVGSTGQSLAMRRVDSVQRATGASDRQAGQLYEQASRALRDGQLVQAIDLMEQAVALSPRDVGYRLLLADAYLKSGRFDSARTTYLDVIELDPANVRAALSVALIHIAQGRPQSAVTRLNEIESRAPVADVGLAFALAGRPDRAIALLESAARSPSATPRIRQNLALAYAMSGDWRRARAIAAQDLSPADIDARMTQWAAFARPDNGAAQVAGLLGVSPAEDPGQPVRLALNAVAPDAAPVTVLAEAEPAPVQSHAEFAPVAEAPAATVLAEAPPTEAPAFWVPTAQTYQPAPVAEAPAPAPAPAPVRVAEAPAAPEPAPATAEAPARPETRAGYRQAARQLITPRPNAVRVAAVRAPLPAPVFQRARPVLRSAVRSGNAPVVVQLGAFSTETNAERAWQQHSRRYNLAGRRPLTTTVQVNGRTMHRVSVAGFASGADAQRLCGQIKAQGGVCFVRALAGDASIRWAARYANPRQRRA